MVKVRALRAHMNACGDAPHKAKGAEYETSEATADALVQTGFVEIVTDEEPKAAKAK